MMAPPSSPLIYAHHQIGEQQHLLNEIVNFKNKYILCKSTINSYSDGYSTSAYPPSAYVYNLAGFRFQQTPPIVIQQAKSKDSMKRISQG